MTMINRFLLYSFLFFSFSSFLAAQVEYTAMTYNIRMETEKDGPDQWKFRAPQLRPRQAAEYWP